MDSADSDLISQMQEQVSNWKAASDRRALFLECYLLMTSKMHGALEGEEFSNPAWVRRLLHRFADYYFDGLVAFERKPSSAPAVWQVAHSAASKKEVLPIQLLMMGISAHINYDLVLTLHEILKPEWSGLPPAAKTARFNDHCRVNQVIGETVDSVQDTVLDPAMPVYDWLDRVLGRFDERLASSLITHWRQDVWSNAVALLEADQPARKNRILRAVEEQALKTTCLIGFQKLP